MSSNDHPFGPDLELSSGASDSEIEMDHRKDSQGKHPLWITMCGVVVALLIVSGGMYWCGVFNMCSKNETPTLAASTSETVLTGENGTSTAETVEAKCDADPTTTAAATEEEDGMVKRAIDSAGDMSAEAAVQALSADIKYNNAGCTRFWATWGARRGCQKCCGCGCCASSTEGGGAVSESEKTASTVEATA